MRRQPLTVGEIARTGLRADVVVLSGCATGDGGELRGEGVLGLTYGFLANGSRSVVASLWPIEDASTARFMSEFYGAYRQGASPPKHCAPRNCARATSPLPRLVEFRGPGQRISVTPGGCSRVFQFKE